MKILNEGLQKTLSSSVIDTWTKNERDLISKTLTKHDFKQWLESLPDDFIVGVACDDKQCVIARYIAAKTGIPTSSRIDRMISIRTGKVLFSRLDAEFEWVWKFICVFDSFDAVYVRKEHCLEMLGKV